MVKDGKIFGKGKDGSGFDRQKAAEQSPAIALKNADISKKDILKNIGYQRRGFRRPVLSQKLIDDLS